MNFTKREEREDMRQNNTNSVLEVARRLHVEYAKTGLYNSADLQKVLGNPKDSVCFTSPVYASSENYKQKKAA